MNYLDELATLLKKQIPTGAPELRNNLGYLPFKQVAKFEVVRALRNLGYRPYSKNPKVLIQRGGKNPVSVDDRHVVLLAPRIVPWNKIQEQMPNSKLTFTNNPLGELVTDKFPKSLSREYGLTFEDGRAFYPVDFKGVAPKQRTTPIDAPIDPEPEPVDPRVAKFGVSPAVLKDLRNYDEKTSRPALLATLKMLWRELNRKFDNQLKEPNFALLPNKGSRMKIRAYWSSSRRLIAASPRLFNAEPHVLLEILLHEMCHQATAELSKVYNEPNQGHGPVWSSWMTRVGLEPDRFDRHGNDVYESPEVQAISKYVRSHQLRAEQRRPGVQCGVWLTDNKIRECVITEMWEDKGFQFIRVLAHDGKYYTAKERPGWTSRLCWLPKYRWDPGVKTVPAGPNS